MCESEREIVFRLDKTQGVLARKKFTINVLIRLQSVLPTQPTIDSAPYTAHQQ
jgi:hypothetical protein